MGDVHDNWEQRILDADDRTEAREVFDEWLAMKVDVHEPIHEYRRQNDVGRLRIDLSDAASPTGQNCTARNLLAKYNRTGRTPLRVINITPDAAGTIWVHVLLADIEPWSDATGI